MPCLFNKLVEFLYLRQKNNLVYYDSLTGVFSRAFYDMKVKQTYLNYESDIIYIDIDNLKETNDRYGHSAGNNYIVSTVDSIRDAINNIDNSSRVIHFCRIGGDEFIIIFKRDDKKISYITNRLSTIKHISFGYYRKERYEDVSSAVRKADKRMYSVKQAKKMR